MRLLRDHQQYCVCIQHSCPPTAQRSSITVAARAQHAWNEWEIQCLVLVSFSLQAFLLFSAGFRKRYGFRALRVLLWLAYLSADSVAVLVLGRLHTGDPDHQLVLFWAPFLLLHLGGQETITAFSMEDCTLWKRHLLNLTTQVALAIYIVGKQSKWDKQLVPPMVLMFIAGTIKYAERTYALWRAGSWAPGRSLLTGTRTIFPESPSEKLASILSSEESIEKNFKLVMEVANEEFHESMGFFMNVWTKRYSGHACARTRTEKEAIVRGFTSTDNGADLAYMFSEIRLSLIYDYLYTKLGNLKGVFNRLTTLVLISTTLVVFVLDRPCKVDHHNRGNSCNGVDVCVSYILLVGAVVLEISSILMWLMSSYWPYMTISYLQGGDRNIAYQCAGRVLHIIIKHLRPRPTAGRVEWSGELQQYNMIDEYIQKEEQPVSWLEKMMRRVHIKQAYTAKHILVSPEVKKVLLDKLCEIAVTPDSQGKFAFTGFHGEWATAWAATRPQQASEISVARKALGVSNIQGMDFVSSALVWHLVTDICLVADETPTVGSKFRTCSQHLSNYIMYLFAQCKLMLDSEGLVVLEVGRFILEKVCFPQEQVGDATDRGKLIQGLSSLSTMKELQDMFFIDKRYDLGIDRVPRVSSELLKSEAANDRWELIAMVWVEMLCYIASNCAPGFHAKHLSAGGEFLTHAKLLVFLPNVQES